MSGLLQDISRYPSDGMLLAAERAFIEAYGSTRDSGAHTKRAVLYRKIWAAMLEQLERELEEGVVE